MGGWRVGGWLSKCMCRENRKGIERFGTNKRGLGRGGRERRESGGLNSSPVVCLCAHVFVFKSICVFVFERTSERESGRKIEIKERESLAYETAG